MKRLIRAEILKLRTTPLLAWMAVGAVGLVAVSVVAGVLGAGDHGNPSLDTSAGVRNVIAAAAATNLTVLIIGILVVTNEFRHGTITSTFLVTPARTTVVAAKLITSAIVGLAFGVAGSLLTLAVALPWLHAKDVSVAFLTRDVGLVTVGAVIAATLYGAIGTSVGSLVRNQVAAVGGTLAWVMVVEALLVSLLPDVGRWLPGGAANALVGTTTPKGGLLPMWGGALLFGAYALILVAAGSRFAVRRDVG
ncbi:MAG: ABC transporter permease [Actinomycetota bacterium]|nr:ABC transporter permease [Actinomycetota bacterium]